MARTNNESANYNTRDDWQEGEWYRVKLSRLNLIPAGSNTGSRFGPTKVNQLDITWEMQDGTEEWIRDWVNLTTRAKNRGAEPSACTRLICAIAGKDAFREATPWVDDESFEFGFDPNMAEIWGQIREGIHMEVSGKPSLDSNQVRRLNVERYRLPQQVERPQAPPTASAPVLSPDGHFQLVDGAWVPLAPPPPIDVAPGQSVYVPNPPTAPVPDDDDLV